MSALVGIYIPAYNADQFIDKAIASVLNQSFRDFELLIVDDASTDNTAEVASSYLENPKVTYFRNEHNLGMSSNWNRGISLLKNKYIAKLDADDFHHPEFLSETISVLENNPGVGMVFSGLNWVTGRGANVTPMLPYTSSWTADGKIFRANLFRKFVCYGPTICVRAECYAKLGAFIDQMRIHTDWEMWTRIASNYEVGYVNKILASAIRHEGNITSASRTGTHIPHDFELWLELLDDGKLPYTLDRDERMTLEAAMVHSVRNLLAITIANKSKTAAEACLRFLLRRSIVPPYEKVRYQLALKLLGGKKQNALLALRGSRWTEKLWPLDRWLAIKIPAQDPYDALGLKMP